MRLLLVKNPDGSYKAFDIVYTPKGASFDNSDKSCNILNIGSRYSGYITIQRIDNSIAHSGQYLNGEFLGLHNYSYELSTTSKWYAPIMLR